jgi:hypothetical protein
MMQGVDGCSVRLVTPHYTPSFVPNLYNHPSREIAALKSAEEINLNLVLQILKKQT